MCENCEPIQPEVKEAFETFEAAIKAFLETMDRNYDVMTDWVLVAAQTKLDTPVDGYAVGWESAINQPTWHTKALLQEAIDGLEANHVAHRLAEHLRD